MRTFKWTVTNGVRTYHSNKQFPFEALIESLSRDVAEQALLDPSAPADQFWYVIDGVVWKVALA